MERKEKLILLTMYLFAIEEVKRLHNSEDIFKFLSSVGMTSGVCGLIGRLKFVEGFQISDKWISKYTTAKTPYWGKTPNNYNYDKEGTLRALKTRVRFLRKELNMV